VPFEKGPASQKCSSCLQNRQALARNLLPGITVHGTIVNE
jgi:hypothetical protein